jgi:hypothetical protein
MTNKQQAKAINAAASGKTKVATIKYTPNTTNQALKPLKTQYGL